ncbi:MAG: hypothetical protein Kow0037_21540 [Calditrichia bacterium]
MFFILLSHRQYVQFSTPLEANVEFKHILPFARCGMKPENKILPIGSKLKLNYWDNIEVTAVSRIVLTYVSLAFF